VEADDAEALDRRVSLEDRAEETAAGRRELRALAQARVEEEDGAPGRVIGPGQDARVDAGLDDGAEARVAREAGLDPRRPLPGDEEKRARRSGIGGELRPEEGAALLEGRERLLLDDRGVVVSARVHGR